LLKSSNRGQTWAPVSAPNLDGLDITGLVVRGNDLVVVAAKSPSADKRGLYRRCSNSEASINKCPEGTAEDTIIRISGLATSGLPSGDYTDIVNAPGNLSAMYTAVVNTGTGADADKAGVYRSEDAGQSWKQILKLSGAVNIRLAGRDDTFNGPSTVFAAEVINASQPGTPAPPAKPRLNRVWITADDGKTWKDMTKPETTEAAGAFGIHPGGQGATRSRRSERRPI
jgi:hypothetical protein